ncbi:MAG: cytochrome C [Cytophagales bacterium]|nr:cytochrome C [Cytophagales bacterium]
MKLTYCIILVALFFLVFSCGKKKEPVNDEEFVANTASSEKPAAQDPIAIGEALVKSNDCSICHHKLNTLIGPSHTAVAQKYEFTKENIKLLAGKIVKGGTGVWGEIPMSAHADVTQGNAEAMARYILSLDGEKEH